MINTIQVYAYQKQDCFAALFQKAIKKMKQDISSYVLYTDHGREALAYHEMKEDLSDKDGIVVLSSITEIGTSIKEQIQELRWFYQSQLILLIINYPVVVARRFCPCLAQDICQNLLPCFAA